MTRKEAYKEMQNGIKITHKYFDKSEYYFLKNGKIIAEDGVDHTHIFWKIDDNNWRETGWEIYVDDSK